MPDLRAGDPSGIGHRRVAGHAGIDLHVVEVGDSDRPAAVVAHGAGSSARFIVDAFAGPVVASGRRLVTFDLRGHGGSRPARHRASHHLDVHATDLAAVAAATHGDIEVVGGVSLGAHAGVRAAAGGRAASAVVLACLPAWTGEATTGHGPHAVIAAEVRDVGIDRVVERIDVSHDLPDWLRDTLLRDYRGHDPASLEAALVALDGAAAPTDTELAALPVPLAVVGWAQDPGHPLEVARDWAARAPSGVLRSLDLSDMDAGLDRLGLTAIGAIDAALVGSPSPSVVTKSGATQKGPE